MKCSKCRLEPHPGARFCGHCGARLPQPDTGAAGPAGATSTSPTPSATTETAPAAPSGSEASRRDSAPLSTAGASSASSKRYWIGIAAAAAIVVVGVGVWRFFPGSGPSGPVASTTPHITPARTANSGNTPAPGLNYIDAYLQGQHCKSCTCLYNNGDPSPLVGSGTDFLANGATFGIEPRLIVAIAGQETSFGLHTCCTRNNNAWNWFWCYASNSCAGQPCQHSPFDSWGSGIKTVSKYMRKTYVNRGYNTIALIGHKYCVDNCSAWVGGVASFYAQLGGDPDHLVPAN